MTMDVTEALCNAAVGLVVSWVATYALLPIWGLHPSLAASGGITSMFFALSLKMIRLSPEEPCISLARVAFNVYDKNGTFAVQLDDQLDAIEIAKSL